MTDQLQTLLTRIAEEAGPGTVDPTLWGRARRARRVQRRQRVAAVLAGAVAVVAVAGVAGVGRLDERPAPPVEEPDRGGPAIPSTIYGVPGDGGLDLETDLAVGPASVAVANATDAFVVTADDGVYHRLRLPGYHAASYDGGLQGVALSPDGTRLAYGWQSPAERADERPRRSGLRILDLTTGDVWGTRFDKVGSLDRAGLADLNVFAWDMRWSPDGTHLGASIALGEVGGLENWYALLDPSARRVLQEFWRAKQWKADKQPYPLVISSTGRVVVVETVPADRLVTLESFRGGTEIGPAPGLATGRFSADGRWLLMAGRDLQTSLRLVEAQAPGRSFELTLPEERYPYGASIDLLGWTGRAEVLALLRPGTGPTTTGADGDLARLTVTPTPGEALAAAGSSLSLDVDVAGRLVAGDTGSVVSIASGLAAGGAPARDFDPPGFAEDLPAPAEPDDTEAVPPAGRPEDGGPSLPMSAVLWGTSAVVLVGAALLLVTQRRRQWGGGRA